MKKVETTYSCDDCGRNCGDVRNLHAIPPGHVGFQGPDEPEHHLCKECLDDRVSYSLSFKPIGSHICRHCNGKGKKKYPDGPHNDYDEVKCSACQGSGWEKLKR